LRSTYDRRSDALYIYLADEGGKVSKTYPCDPREVNGEVNGEINLDFDASGRLIGIEVLEASRLAPRPLLKGR